MTTILLILAPILLFAIYTIAKFAKYKADEKQDREFFQLMRFDQQRLIGFCVLEHLAALCRVHSLDISTENMERMADKMTEFEGMMDFDNMMDLYSTFLHRYVFKLQKRGRGPKINNDRLKAAIDEMTLQERSGYFLLKPDAPEAFDRIYPE